jgi:hypothetical protein
MMKPIACISLLFALISFTPAAQASWHYNENAGFGIYHPEGWSAKTEGRSSLLRGPLTDTSQSEIFLGSDWAAQVKDLGALEAFVKRETGDTSLEPVAISERPGFRSGSLKRGALHVLRAPGNIIVVEYDLRGSPAQIEEAATMLDSIEIRTRGIEN